MTTITAQITFRDATWTELLAARARILFSKLRRAPLELAEVAQPTMAWRDTRGACYRPQPRDGAGRFLSKAWLLRAELYTASDLAWFRSSLPEGK